MTSSIHRAVDAIVAELSARGDCHTCYGSPVRTVYADGETMPATGCPICGRAILRTHYHRWMTTVQAARLFRPAGRE